MIEPKPYKLHNTIQHYDWGTKNKNAFIPQLLGSDFVIDKPYAELWIGAHPKAPSQIIIDHKSYKLNEIIEKYPTEILGENIAKNFNNKFPFLLKILSAEKALSIQTHPNKHQAERLNKKDPINYPDDNHKPEIAIAINGLTAIAGFKPVDEIVEIFKTHNEFRDFVGADVFDEVINGNKNDIESNIKLLYKSIMEKAGDKDNLEFIIDQLIEKFSKTNQLEQEEKQFIEQYKLYGHDIGLISFFLFNLIELKPRQAIFTDAGIPHAYIKGNIIECMANSDNVVRAGLTKKFKDVEVLIDILNYKFEHYQIINDAQQNDEVIYRTKAKEFEITLFNKHVNYNCHYFTNNKPIVYLIMDGTIEVKFSESSESELFHKGESFLIPALINSYGIIIKKDAEFIRVEVP